jgi:hypothetical protein
VPGADDGGGDESAANGAGRERPEGDGPLGGAPDAGTRPAPERPQADRRDGGPPP